MRDAKARSAWGVRVWLEMQTWAHRAIRFLIISSGRCQANPSRAETAPQASFNRHLTLIGPPTLTVKP